MRDNCALRYMALARLQTWHCLSARIRLIILTVSPLVNPHWYLFRLFQSAPFTLVYHPPTGKGCTARETFSVQAKARRETHDYSTRYPR